MYRQTTPAQGFQTPSQMANNSTGGGAPSDSKDHWASGLMNYLVIVS